MSPIEHEEEMFGDPCEDIEFNDFNGDDDRDGQFEFASLYPQIFKNEHIDISADYEWGCYHIVTGKWITCWYWTSNAFVIIEKATNRSFDFPFKGNLDYFFECTMEDIEDDFGRMRHVVKEVVSADHQKFDGFVERYFSLKVFS